MLHISLDPVFRPIFLKMAENGLKPNCFSGALPVVGELEEVGQDPAEEEGANMVAQAPAQQVSAN